MSVNTGNSGVRNLRAMFENKGGDTSNSPPSRGRSPSGSVASTSSRPVSKVRASFVAVERSGEQGQLWGLRKASDVSSMAEVARENESSVVDGPPLAITKSTPEKNTTDSLGSILKGSSFAKTPMKEEPNKMDAIEEKEKSPRKPTSVGDQNKQPQTNGIGARAAGAAKRIQDKAKVSATKPNPKPIETKTSSTNADKKSPRTPTSAGIKPRGGVAKVQGVIDSAKKAAEGREASKKPSTTTTVKTPTTPKSPAKAKVVKEATSSPRTTTAPKSPAKPAKLPSHATAPTEASAAHHRPEKTVAPPKKHLHSERPVKLPSAVTATTAASTAHERSTQDPAPKKPVTRRLSAAQPTTSRLSTTGTQASLAKKASRASLADRPKSRSSLSKPDEGFLARMMRPTQSSASKTHEKAPVSSPPKHKPAAVKPKAPASTRPSLNGHAHHDHHDEDGDYSKRTPTSPTFTKHVQIASQKPTTPKKAVAEKQEHTAAPSTPQSAKKPPAKPMEAPSEPPKTGHEVVEEPLPLTEEPKETTAVASATVDEVSTPAEPQSASALSVEEPSVSASSTKETDTSIHSQSQEEPAKSAVVEPLELSEQPTDADTQSNTAELPTTTDAQPEVGEKTGPDVQPAAETAAV